MGCWAGEFVSSSVFSAVLTWEKHFLISEMEMSTVSTPLSGLSYRLNKTVTEVNCGVLARGKGPKTVTEKMRSEEVEVTVQTVISLKC